MIIIYSNGCFKKGHVGIIMYVIFVFTNNQTQAMEKWFVNIQIRQQWHFARDSSVTWTDAWKFSFTVRFLIWQQQYRYRCCLPTITVNAPHRHAKSVRHVGTTQNISFRLLIRFSILVQITKSSDRPESTRPCWILSHPYHKSR